MKHNFNAGPSKLSDYSVKKSAEAVLNFENTGLSILEVSHRSKQFDAVMEEARQLVKDLLDVPQGYSVLFLQGGATLQFAMLPYSLLKTKAAYLNTGTWATKAIADAKLFGEVNVVASSKDKNFNYIPKGWEAAVTADNDYCHITTNNTIFGTEIHNDPSVSVLLAADMSSDIFSRPIDVSKYGIIYAGAQKNIGPSGATLVIIKDSLLENITRPIPAYLDYRLHIKDGSMYNTPATLPVYSSLLTLQYYKQLGGMKAILKLNQDKAALLYNEIDRNKLFQAAVPAVEDRSIMNVTWVMKEEYKELENAFNEFASSKGMIGIKGHRSVGGFRASIYNAVPKESVQALIDAMKEFEKAH